MSNPYQIPDVVRAVADYFVAGIKAGSFLRWNGTAYQDQHGHTIPAALVRLHFNRGRVFTSVPPQPDLFL